MEVSLRSKSPLRVSRDNNTLIAVMGRHQTYFKKSLPTLMNT